MLKLYSYNVIVILGLTIEASTSVEFDIKMLLLSHGPTSPEGALLPIWEPLV
jgi:hypothetical protein